MSRVDLQELQNCQDVGAIGYVVWALPMIIEEIKALRKLADALKKAREEHYCNVPVEVDDALAVYKRLVGEK